MAECGFKKERSLDGVEGIFQFFQVKGEALLLAEYRQVRGKRFRTETVT